MRMHIVRELWETLRKMKERREPITAKVVRIDKFGVQCNYQGLAAFMPMAQLVGDADESLVGQDITVSAFQSCSFLL